MGYSLMLSVHVEHVQLSALDIYTCVYVQYREYHIAPIF